MRHFNIFNKGFSLIELALVMCVMAVLLGGLSPAWMKQMYQQAGEKLVDEMLILKKMSDQYLKEQGVWPESVEALKTQGYLHDLWENKNPFNKPYELLIDQDRLFIRCDIPPQAVSMILVKVPMGIQDEKGIMMPMINDQVNESLMPTATIVPMATENVPEGWLLCDGREINREEYQELFSFIGTHYGEGDGKTTFHLPDLRGRTIVGLDNMGGVQANVIKEFWAKEMGGVYGSEKHLLTMNEMPRHKHDTPLNISFGDTGQPAMESGRRYHAENYPSTYAGGDQPHNNIQPSMALNWIIKT